MKGFEHMNNIINANSNIQRVVAEARSRFKAIREDLTLPEESKPKIIEQERAKYLEQLAQATAAAQSAIQQDKQAVKQAADKAYLPAGDPVAGIAADEQTWRRLRGLLDSGIGLQQILEDAVSRNDKRAIKVLSEEYRYYEWQRGRSDLGDSVGPLFDQAKAATSAAYDAAMQAVAKIDRAAKAVDYNISSADKALRDDSAPALFVDHEHNVIPGDDNE